MGAGIGGSLALANAYLRTRLLKAAFTDRGRITRWHARRVEALRRHAIANTTFYRRLGEVPFVAFPVVSKEDVMTSFEEFNVLGLSAEEAWRLLDRGATPPGHALGCSTGTSGNRGLYVVSDRERFTWLGIIVAKALPDVLRRRHRVAIILPRASRLYEAGNEARLVRLQFFDLRIGFPALVEDVVAFRPTVVVAPPKVLRWMAERRIAIKPERMFTSAEVLDETDRMIIEASYGLKLGQIYMATEGLFGVSCSHGTMHLAEDVMHFEYEQVGEAPNLVSLIVTDFTRRTQVMARYRLNDLLRLATRPCPCGSALQAVAEIVGRCDDCFLLPSRELQGSFVTLTPDVLRNAVVGANRYIDDFRLLQTDTNAIDLVLAPSVPDEAAAAAMRSVIAACSSAGAAPHVRLRRESLQLDEVVKLRRVERRWAGR